MQARCDAMEEAMRNIGMVAVLLCLGCGAEPGLPDVETTRSAQNDAFYPAGMMCGNAYLAGSSRWVDGTCQGKRTLSFELAQGYNQKSVGDSGMPSGSGFYHQFWAGPAATQSDRLVIPRGTACGMKQGCFDFGNTCMGKNPAQECPFGWTPKKAFDLKAPGGCYFHWCEYQDPNNLCPEGNCPIIMPQGLTCGLTDNDAGTDDSRTGRCYGRRTWNDDCPSGFQRFGFFDDGRKGGHGVGWCAKL
jgi:hypothetical protein